MSTHARTKVLESYDSRSRGLNFHAKGTRRGKYIHVAVFIDPEPFEVVKKIAKRKKQSVSATLRELVDFGLAVQEE